MIRWMAEHKVAANLLMVIILLSGLMGILNIKQEVFPEMELDFIVVAVRSPSPPLIALRLSMSEVRTSARGEIGIRMKTK